MSDLSFTFDEAPWETALEALKPGDTMSAAAFLTLLEGENEEALEDAFQLLTDQGARLDLSDLPRAAAGEAAVRLRLEEQLAKQQDMTEGLEQDDPLRLYLEELASLPVCGDPAWLSEEAARGSQQAQKNLLEISLSRVVELARTYAGRGVLLLDLIQEGSLGLWQSILNYQSGDFARSRDWWIRTFMDRAVVTQARERGVGQHLRQAMEDYRAVDERLLSELGRNPTVEELAQQLHMSPEETDTVRKMIDSARSLQQVKARQEEPEQTPENEQAVEDTAYFQMRQRISELLSVLSEEDAKLLTLRFGLEGGLPMTEEEVGSKLGIPAHQVAAREAAALAKMRSDG